MIVRSCQFNFNDPLILRTLKFVVVSTSSRFERLIRRCTIPSTMCALKFPGGVYFHSSTRGGGGVHPLPSVHSPHSARHPSSAQFLSFLHHRNLSCLKRQLHKQLQLVPHDSKQSSKQPSSPTKGRPRRTFSRIRLQPSFNPAILQTPSSPSFKFKFKNLTNLAVATPD